MTGGGRRQRHGAGGAAGAAMAARCCNRVLFFCFASDRCVSPVLCPPRRCTLTAAAPTRGRPSVCVLCAQSAPPTPGWAGGHAQHGRVAQPSPPLRAGGPRHRWRHPPPVFFFDARSRRPRRGRVGPPTASRRAGCSAAAPPTGGAAAHARAAGRRRSRRRRAPRPRRHAAGGPTVGMAGRVAGGSGSGPPRRGPAAPRRSSWLGGRAARPTRPAAGRWPTRGGWPPGQPHCGDESTATAPRDGIQRLALVSL